MVENGALLSPCERDGEGGEKPIIGRPCARAQRHLGIGGHVKFAVRTENFKGDIGRCGECTGLVTFRS
ncbi:hypothetical protein EVAR_12630_1 [Eumeta japonica]|uniref:Uncharacterized protein n=1 Tax=Eumeta variegata TaxID=151549 RepID=A0A4C1UEQ2_EUMVA|nr:hypothetical protein EVAR_12630_1 [Eumeta japonica]